jgi:uncharacterized protein YuzE
MRLTFDEEAGALYLLVRDVPVARTVASEPAVNVDLDDAGGLVGVEVLDVHRLPVVPALLARYGAGARVNFTALEAALG